MNADLLSWAVAFELSLPFIVATIVLSVLLIKSKKKSKASLRLLILNIKDNESIQKENLREYLSGKLMLDDKQVRIASKKIINERKFLFRNLISGVLDNNSEELAGLEDDLSRIIDHYHNLDFEATKESSVTESEDEIEIEIGEDNGEQEALEAEIKALNEEVLGLKQETKTLKQEVHITLTTLNKIFSEFSSMFGEKIPESEMSVDEIIKSMESFTAKSESAVETKETKETTETVDAVSATTVQNPNLEAEADALTKTSDLDAALEETAIADVATNEQEKAEPNTMVGIDEEVEPELDIEPEDLKALEDELDFSIDSELDDIDSALDDLELGQSNSDEEPSWGDAFEESGDTMEDEK